VVGDNEVGKSTLLEAIHAVVTGQLHGRNCLPHHRIDLTGLRTGVPKPVLMDRAAAAAGW
jgi:hypothetical protein